MWNITFIRSGYDKSDHVPYSVLLRDDDIYYFQGNDIQYKTMEIPVEVNGTIRQITLGYKLFQIMCQVPSLNVAWLRNNVRKFVCAGAAEAICKFFQQYRCFVDQSIE